MACNCMNAAAEGFALDKVGRPRAKATASRLQLRPLELESIAIKAATQPTKRRLQCGVLPLIVKEPPPKVFGADDEDLTAAKPRKLPCIYENSHTASQVQSQAWRYFSECDRMSKMPTVPRFLLTADPADLDKPSKDPLSPVSPGGGRAKIVDVDVNNEEMRDSDLLALVEPLRAVSSSPVRLDISRNRVSDEAVASFICDLAVSDLRSLNLAHCGASTLAIDAVRIRMEQ